jgi:hypothetical protein
MSARQSEHPRDGTERLVAQRGHDGVAAACVALLEGHDVDDDVVEALGGTGATRLLDRPRNAYWARVWGARGLLYCYDACAVPALAAATHDEHWRVREMVAKVVAKHRVDALAGDVAPLRGHPVPRVRAAAERALVTLAR